MKYKYFIFPVILYFLLIGFGLNNTAVQEPEATPIEKALKQEYDLIPVIPDASLIESEASHKSDIAWVEGTFSTKLEFEDVRKYYDKELTNKGWRFYKETKTTVPYKGHKYEAKVFYYLKGNYVVWLENPGMFDKEETFALSVTWGLEPG